MITLFTVSRYCFRHRFTYIPQLQTI